MERKTNTTTNEIAAEAGAAGHDTVPSPAGGGRRRMARETNGSNEASATSGIGTESPANHAGRSSEIRSVNVSPTDEPPIVSENGEAGATSNASTGTVQHEARIPAAPRANSKIAQVVILLERTEGATLAELVEATGWQPHTTRAALTGLRKKGKNLVKDKRVRLPATGSRRPADGPHRSRG